MTLSYSKAHAVSIRALGWVTAMLAGGVLGCDGPTADGDLAEGASAMQAGPSAMQPDPGAVTFAEVRTNGTGCPPGSANTSISADGLVFTTTFSNYFTEVNPSAELGVKDCQLEITLRMPAGMSYAVQSFYYSGYALLQEGVVGRQTASYYFQGNPVAPVESNRTDLRGPYDRPYLFTDDVPVQDRVWSPCGVERNLNVRTRVQLFNGEPRRTGYMSLNAIDGSSKMVLKLSTRSCADSGTTTPPNQQAPDASAPLKKLTGVTVEPNVLTPDQSFVVRWNKLAEEPLARYRVQVHAPPAFGSALLWESPETITSSVTYMGPTLAFPGIYTVTVIARRDAQEARSDAMPLEVRVGAPQQPPSDPTPPPSRTGSVPEWAAPLAGRYAMRVSGHFNSSVGTMLASREISLAEIVETPEGLEFRSRLCSLHNVEPGSTTTIANPERYPELRRKIILAAGIWSTDDAPFTVGYDLEVPPTCVSRPGGYVTKSPEQVWIRGGSCRCPRTASDAPRADDCRVSDPDGDGQPGLTFESSLPLSTRTALAHYAVLLRDHAVGGQVRADGAHVARMLLDNRSFMLNCEGTDAGCVEFTYTPCSAANNTLQLARLPAPPAGYARWTCEALLSNQDRVLPRAPARPTRCR